MSRPLSNNLFYFLVAAILCWSVTASLAGTLEVGSGKAYSTIQSAINAAYSSDEIIVYAGVYTEFVMVNSKDNMHIHAYANPEDIDGNVSNRVIVEGGFRLSHAKGNVIQGFYVTAGPDGNIPAQTNAALSIHEYNYSENNQWRDMVVYNVNPQLAAFGGSYGYKWNQVYDCTIYGNTKAGDFADSSGVSMYSTIIAFNGDRWYTPGYGTYVRYSDWYQNPTDGGFGKPDIYNSGDNINWGVPGGADPLFVSTTPSDDHFLWIALASPCVGSAHDGGNMGALPDIDEPPVEPVELLSIDPAEGETLCRKSNNQIKLICSEGLDLGELPSVPLIITKIGTDTEEGANFTYSLATTNVADDTLVATENGTVLENKTWYRIEPSDAWVPYFAIEVPTLRGDVDASGKVDMFDHSSLAAAWGDTGGQLGRVDLDGDNDVDTVDLSILADGWMEQAVDHPLAQVSFTKFTENPLIEPSIPTDSGDTLHCAVRRAEDGTYNMLYSGSYGDSNGTRRIHLATSSDGITFTKQGVVIDESGSGYHAHIPTLLWDPDAGAIGLWKAWYMRGKAICYATSTPDCQTWTKYAGNPVFSKSSDPGAFDSAEVCNNSVIYDADEGIYKMWYQGNDGVTGYRLGYATSPDGINWTRRTEPLYNYTQIYRSPEVIKINDVYHMFHNVGGDLGYSVSLDGINWVDDPDNPILEPTSGTWDEQYLQAPSVVYHPATDKLYMYYNGCQYDSYPTDWTERIGAAWTWFWPR